MTPNRAANVRPFRPATEVLYAITASLRPAWPDRPSTSGRGWRATLYVSGIEALCETATGSAWEGTPWGAVQRAAGGALTPRRRPADRTGVRAAPFRYLSMNR